MQERTISIILAGGVGSRLHPLTAERAKPAVPFGGRYRIIDFTLSNCLHSGLRRVLVLTQYKSQSLQQHLRDGWSIYNSEIGEYITPVPPQMRTGQSWYSGTADAIYQNLNLLEDSRAEYVLILSGDHVYRMDYAAMLRRHHDSGADVTVACLTVDLAQASAFGLITVDAADRVVSFDEKPERPQGLPDDPGPALASMGVYVFSTKLLASLLENDHHA
jgi:glucose-1-phosphate adenylyltransferase